jgi:hypothetical protein
LHISKTVSQLQITPLVTTRRFVQTSPFPAVYQPKKPFCNRILQTIQTLNSKSNPKQTHPKCNGDSSSSITQQKLSKNPSNIQDSVSPPPPFALNFLYFSVFHQKPYRLNDSKEKKLICNPYDPNINLIT